jgi:hypothetical protein
MYQYSFANVDLNIVIPTTGNGDIESVKMTGYPAGDQLITIARKAPIATTQFGAYGDLVVSMQLNRSADLSFPLLMSAPENEILQNYANWFQSQAGAGGQLVVPIQADMTDNMGKDVARLTNGVILAIPAMVRGQNMNTVTWVMTFEKVVFERHPGEDAVLIGDTNDLSPIN